MNLDSSSLRLTWDAAIAETVDQSQRWILSAMQSNGPALVTMLWRITGNAEDVSDAYQETFLRLAHLPNQQKPDNIRAYLFRTASNVAITLLRQKRLHAVSIQEMARARRDSYLPDTAGDLDGRQLQKRLREAIAQLPDYLGDVVVLRDLGELSYSQVAATLGITNTAARVYRHKAIGLLAQWLDKTHRGDL
jgi:RNA polymerase sigma factor (sigma-70 family)